MSTLKTPQQKITLESIELALKQVETKKQSLRKAFENLQAHSSFSVPSLSWFHIDSHFSSLYSNLFQRFSILQNSLQPDPCDRPGSDLNSDTIPIPIANGLEKSQNRCDPVETRPKSVALEDASTSCERLGGELVRICREMDGKNLREYVIESGKVRGELVSAMRVAADPGLLVLEAIEGFNRSNLGSKGEKDGELFRLRRICLELLEVIVEIRPSLSGEVRERAKMLALEWKGKVNLKGESTCEALGLLNLVVGYGLESEFDAGEFMEYFYAVASFKQAPALCKAIDLGEKTCELIQRLIDNGKRLLAVKFIFECGMTDKFLPVPLLRTHLEECRKFSDKACNDGKSTAKQQIEDISREVNALRSVIEIIDEHMLESEYPKIDLGKRLEFLERQQIEKKNFIPPYDYKPQPQQAKVQPKKQQPQQPRRQHQQQQPRQHQHPQHPKRKRQKPQQQLNGNKRARVAVSSVPIAVSSVPMAISSVPAQVPSSFTGSSSIMHLFQQSSQLPTAPYGLAGSTPAVAPYAGPTVAPYAVPSVAPYAGPSVAPYGLPGPAMGFYGNPNPVPVAHPYAQESYAPSGVYDGSAGYSGYGLPQQYHPAYYPQ